MPIRFDHIVIAVNDLATASEHFGQAGFQVIPGGEHANGVTHNALVTFDDGSYFEIIAFKRPGDKPEPHKWWEKLQQREGTVDFALSSDDVAAEAARLRAAGVAVEGPTPNGRLRPDGKRLDWRTINLSDPVAPLPFMIDDQTPRELRVPPAPATTHPLGVSGVAGLVLLTTDLEAAAARYAALLGGEGETVSPTVPGANAARRFAFGDQWIELDEAGSNQPDLVAYARERGPGAWRIVLRSTRGEHQSIPEHLVHGASIRIAPAGN